MNYLLRAFTRTLNDIVRYKSLPEFCSKYIRGKGHLYIFLYPHEKEYKLNEMHFSKKNSIDPTTAQTFTPSNPKDTTNDNTDTTINSNSIDSHTNINANSHTIDKIQINTRDKDMKSIGTPSNENDEMMSLASTDAKSITPTNLPVAPTNLPIAPTNLPISIPTPTILPFVFPLYVSVNPAVNQTSTSVDNQIKINKVEPPRKFELPGTLAFFMGQKRAKKVMKDITAGVSDNCFEDILVTHLTSQIEKLQNANLYFEGWKCIVQDNDVNGQCTHHDVDRIRNKATYVAMIYYLSLKHYEEVNDFS